MQNLQHTARLDNLVEPRVLHSGFQPMVSCTVSYWHLQCAAAMLSTCGGIVVGGALCGPE